MTDNAEAGSGVDQEGSTARTESTRDAMGWLAWQVERIRLRVGAAIIGGRWLRMTYRHVIIADRARQCITRDGRVELASCEPLAEALYAEMPGEWTLYALRWEPPERAVALVVDRSWSTPKRPTR